MKLLFWACVGLIAYTYVIYPLLIWVLSRVRHNEWRRETIQPSLTVIMAVHNGGERLAGKLEDLARLDYPNISEIIVVSDGSTDSTASVLERLSHPKMKPIVLEQWGGKATALNHGIAASTGEIILFVDFRPSIPAGSIQHLVSNFADPRVGCVAGELLLDSAGQDAGAAAVGGLYWRYEQWIRDCEARFDSPLGVYGGYYAIRRELAVKFPDGTILDDMYMPLSIIRQRYRSVLDRDAKVFDAWPKTASDEFRRKVRTLAGNYQLIQLAPWLLGPKNRVAFQLWSHKWFRLLVPYLLVIILALSVDFARIERGFAVFTALQIVFYLAAWIGSRLPSGLLRKVGGTAHAFCMLNLAAAVALHRFLFTRGPLWQIWGTPQVTTTSARAASTGR